MRPSDYHAVKLMEEIVYNVRGIILCEWLRQKKWGKRGRRELSDSQEWEFENSLRLTRCDVMRCSSDTFSQSPLVNYLCKREPFDMQSRPAQVRCLLRWSLSTMENRWVMKQVKTRKEHNSERYLYLARCLLTWELEHVQNLDSFKK